MFCWKNWYIITIYIDSISNFVYCIIIAIFSLFSRLAFLVFDSLNQVANKVVTRRGDVTTYIKEYVTIVLYM